VSTIRARHARCGRRGNRSPASGTTGSTRSGTAAKSRPAWPSPTAAACSSAGGRGLVRQVLDKTTLATHQGHLAIGHTRHSATGPYATGSPPWENAQPPFTTTAAGGRITIARNGDLTTTAALAGHLIPQESPSGWPVQPRATSDPDVIAQVGAREGDLSLEEAVVRTMPRLGAVTATAGPAGIGPAQGLYPACFTERYPIPTPDAAVADLRRSATTQPPTLPLPNPSQRS
jgi:hypothetical protein